MQALLTKRIIIPGFIMMSASEGIDEFKKFHEQNIAAELGREFFSKHAGKDMWKLYIEYEWRREFDMGPQSFLSTEPPYNYVLTVALYAEKMFLRKEPTNG